MNDPDTQLNWPELEPGEDLLSEGNELLWRQASPSHFKDGGQITSQVFRPSSSDGGKMSASRSSVQTADGAYDFHTKVLGLSSAGTWAVSVAEVRGSGTRAVDDSRSPTGPPEPCPPGHVYIDVRPYSARQVKRIGALLLEYAVERGKQFPD